MSRVFTWTASTALAVGLLPAATQASSVYAEYHAGPTTSTSTPAKVWSPELWGWYDLNSGSIGPAGAGTVNTGGSGLNAWRVTDQRASLPNSIYVTDFLSPDLARIAVNGWRMSSTIRYVNDFGGGPNLGMSAFLGGRAYHMMLDLTASGDLRVTLHDETTRSYQITNNGLGTAALHRFQFINTPQAATVALSVDGVVLDSTWDGILLANHPSNVQWGNSDQAGVNLGVADYQEVLFEIGPFTESRGDFNGNGVVDGADFMIWQNSASQPFDLTADANGDGRVDGADLAVWKTNFGTRSTTATVSEVPEPVSSVLLAVGGLAGVMTRHSQRRL
ncbi:dockerin type I domain-containing protein [Lacipirellula parvula]|uniref:PEP-CTERM protein-sorting domain-containing protein n=1 Tax=Lacipirellula parvula TaxID=2650471 RepID=A0A5K7XIQ7_9BACT|nr:dockerin type I domain-containing protein [Lacipirellula parvula]BBO35917.1 hypothetical protein PLANPX_5529 [Lacipirellula parvula]